MNQTSLLAFTILATIRCTKSSSFASQTPAPKNYFGLVKKIINGSGEK